MASLFADTSGQPSGTTDIAKENKIIEISVTDILGQIKLVEFENVERYTLIRTTISNDFRSRKVLFPIEQRNFTDIPDIYDVSVLNVRLNYNQAPNDRCDSMPFILLQLKSSFLADLSASQLAKRYSLLRFTDLMLFIASIDITSKYANFIINETPTDGIISQGGTTPLNLAAMGQDLLSLAKTIKDNLARQRATVLINNTFRESDLTPAYQDVFGRLDVDPNLRDSLRDYSLQIVPLSPIQRQCLNVALRLFNQQYYHPSLMLNEIRRILPNNVEISNDTNRLIHEKCHPRVRVARFQYGFRRFNHMYLWPGTADELRSIINGLIDIRVEIKNQGVVLQGLNQILRISNVASKQGDDISTFINSMDIIPILSAIIKTWINVNLYIVNFSIPVDVVSRSFYSMLSILMTMRLIPASVVPLSTRIRINNVFAIFIMKHVVRREIHIEDFPLLPQDINSPLWASTDVDFLAIVANAIYQVLPAPRRATLRIFFDSYFQGQFNRIAHVYVRRTRNGDERIPASTILPWLNGLDSYEYDTIQGPEMLLRERLFGNQAGPILPTNMEDVTQMDVPVLTAIRAVRGLLDSIPRNVNDGVGFPTSYPNRELCTAILNELEESAPGAFRQLYYIYRENLIKFSLSPASDSRVAPDMSIKNKKWLTIPLRTVLSIPFLLSPRSDELEIAMPQYLMNLTILARSEFFIGVYRVVDQMARVLPPNGFEAAGDERIRLRRTERLEISKLLTARILGDEGFDPLGEFLGSSYTQGELIQMLDTMPQNEPISERVRMYFDTIAEVNTIIRPLFIPTLMFDHFFIVRNAGAFHLTNRYITPPLMGTSTVSRAQIHTVRTIQNLSTLRNELNAPESFNGVLLDVNPFRRDFRELRKISSEELIYPQPLRPMIDAIRVNVPIKIVLNVIKVSDLTKMSLSHRGATFEDMSRSYIDIANSLATAELLEVPVTIVVNDLGSSERSWAVPITALYDEFTKLTGSEIIVPLEDVMDSHRFNFQVMPVEEFITYVAAPIPVRKTPFDIAAEIPITLNRSLD
nr:major core protein [Reoviridae sp.]